MSRRERANVCVAGCGHWGKNLVRNFESLRHLYAICDADEVRLQALARQMPSVRTFTRLEHALADRDVDAVALATPAEQHHAMGLSVLRAGKDLFVEKPMALEWPQGWEMLETARQHGCMLMVGHLLQYHPAIVKIRDMLRSGVLGRIDYIYSNRLSMGKIRREENALWSFAPHDISVILMLMEQMPVQVTATGGAYLQPNIADVTVSHLLFDRGTRAHIFVSWLHPYKEQRLVVIGSKQMVVFEDSRAHDKLVLYDMPLEVKNGIVEASKPEGVSVPIDATEALRLECAHFIDCVIQRTEPRTPGEEGIRVLQVLQACQRSLQMNGQPVQVEAAGAPRILNL